jgi:hypothetical protein
LFVGVQSQWFKTTRSPECVQADKQNIAKIPAESRSTPAARVGRVKYP